jgi:hypothetical protein
MLRAVASRCKRTACLCVIGAALVLAACGDAGCDTPPVTLSVPRTEATVRELTAARFEALERVYEAALPLDAFRAAGAGSQYELEAATRSLLDACRQLDASDPLLGPLRSECSTGARVVFAAAGIVECQCEDAYEAVGRAIRRFVAAAHAADRAVDDAQLTPACENTLVVAASAYAYYQQLATAIGMKQRALGSESGEWAAELALRKASEMSRLQPTYDHQLRELRAGCR